MVIFTILALPCPIAPYFIKERISFTEPPLTFLHLSVQAGGIITDGPHTCPVSDEGVEVSDHPLCLGIMCWLAQGTDYVTVGAQNLNPKPKHFIFENCAMSSFLNRMQSCLVVGQKRRWVSEFSGLMAAG